MTDLEALAGLAPELANTFATIASDIALVIDADGIIRNAAMADAAIGREADQWVGCRFADTVTQDTRAKIEMLLQDVRQTGVSRRREVNVSGVGGASIPVAFAAIRLGANGPVLAVGRDLRAIAAIQQQFVHAQQEMERDYWRQRQSESQLRQLFQVATDAVLVVDANTFDIVRANPVATRLLGPSTLPLEGRPLVSTLDGRSRPAVEELLGAARASGKPAEIRARLPAAGASADAAEFVDVSATPFRTAANGASQTMLLVRLRRVGARLEPTGRRLAEVVERLAEAVAITDSHGRLQVANGALLALCADAATAASARGRSLADLLRDPAGRLAHLITDVRRLGLASASRLPIGAGASGTALDVTAALIAEGDQERIGLTLVRATTRSAEALQPVLGLARAIEDLSTQLGRTPLPQLVQQASHLAERHLILGALEHANGHVRSAAGRLGITAENLSARLIALGLVADGDTPHLPN